MDPRIFRQARIFHDLLERRALTASRSSHQARPSGWPEPDTGAQTWIVDSTVNWRAQLAAPVYRALWATSPISRVGRTAATQPPATPGAPASLIDLYGLFYYLGW